jgi:D-tyrosyl-tRNA(Tyr) deacylase
MIGLLQRVSRASVTVAGSVIATIGPGILVFIGIEKTDTHSQAERLIERLLSYRLFSDQHGKMNLSVSDIAGGLLLVPQFTLVADTQKGTRPSFSSAAPPRLALELFQYCVVHAQQRYANIASGQFAADMQVELVNEGPVTFWLQANEPNNGDVQQQN